MNTLHCRPARPRNQNPPPTHAPPLQHHTVCSRPAVCGVVRTAIAARRRVSSSSAQPTASTASISTCTKVHVSAFYFVVVPEKSQDMGSGASKPEWYPGEPTTTADEFDECSCEPVCLGSHGGATTTATSSSFSSREKSGSASSIVTERREITSLPVVKLTDMEVRNNVIFGAFLFFFFHVYDTPYLLVPPVVCGIQDTLLL